MIKPSYLWTQWLHVSFVVTLLGTAFSAAPFEAQVVTASAPEVFGKVYHCKPGPWGNLDYYYIYLEAPERLVENFPMPNTITKWSFPGATAADLKSLFSQAGLTEPLQDYLLDSKHIVKEEGALTVFPPLPDLLAMTPGQRTVIYKELAKSELNEFQNNPVFITSGSVEQWLGQSRLSGELIEIISKFTYMRGNVLVFSDLSAVLNYVQSDAEARDFFKTMTRTRSLMVRIKLDKSSNIEAITNYWTGQNRNKDIEPMLTSAVESEGIEDIDVIHLLPSLPRRFVFGYPPKELAILGRMPDCHWTSLNFFNFKPKDYFLDTRLATAHVLEKYAKVDPPYHFGDVLMFLTPKGDAIHSCNYIADDIVYTKNGENMIAPWVLMKISDVLRIYSNESQSTIQGFRLKEASK
ncbi:hypothetical protein BH11VER1_BH11VER1_26430 [soil metagenome]